MLKAIDSSFRYTAEKILKNVPQSSFKKLELHQKAIEVNREYAEQRGYDEESMYRLSVAHHLVANDAENCHQFELASFHRKCCLAIVEPLAKKYPTNAKYQFDLFTNRFLTSHGDTPSDDYLGWLLEAREHLQCAMSLEPDNPDYEDADAAICFRLGFFDSAKSREWIELAIRKSMALGKKHPDKPHYFKHAIGGHHAISQNDIREKKWDSACEHCAIALEIIENHFRKSHDVADIQTAYVTTLDYYAQALEHMDIERAIEVYEQYAIASAEVEKLETKYEFYQLNRALAYLSQAKLLHRLGHLATSKSSYGKAATTLATYHPTTEPLLLAKAAAESEMAQFDKLLSSQDSAQQP
jgi:hypothetical protein